MKIFLKIKGTPYGQQGGGNAAGRLGRKKWSDDIIEQTKDQFPVKGPCEMKVVFVLPSEMHPKDHPYGTDLDNLLKRFQDALNKTIFSKVLGNDGCVRKLYAEKQKVGEKESGAELEITELEF